MTTVVVLGMHRSGTSLTASILDALGVNMGRRLFMQGHGSAYPHYEDLDFMELNKRLLAAAGGDWEHPPSAEVILQAGMDAQDEIFSLIRYKEQSPIWGWKDPRTVLTIGCYEPYLRDAYYVVPIRSREQVILSLLHRHPEDTVEKFEALHDTYIERLNFFLSGKDHVQISYPLLLKPDRARGEIQRVVDHIGLFNLRFRLALDRIGKP